jgi:hypothetical protein
MEGAVIWPEKVGKYWRHEITGEELAVFEPFEAAARWPSPLTGTGFR